MTREQLIKINEFMFNKKESIVIQPSETKYNSQLEHAQTVVALMKNLSDLGYELDSVEPLLRMSKEDLKELVYEPLLAEAKRAKGAHVEHRLLFRNFPDDVVKLDIDTLSDIRFASYFTTIIDSHFLGQDPFEDGSITRDFVERMVSLACDNAAEKAGIKSRASSLDAVISDEVFLSYAPKLIEKVKEETKDVYAKENEKNRMIRIATTDDYFAMVKNMLSARTSLSPYDVEIVQYTIDNFEKEEYMPDKIQFKETQVLLDKYNFEKRYLQNIDIKSINDFKRLLIALSEGDISSKKNQKIKNFSNQDRKALYQIFENAVKNNYPIMVESMANRSARNFEETVLRKHLHLNAMCKNGVYQRLINDVKEYETVNQKYEQCLKNKEFDKAATLLSKSHQKLLIDRARNLIWLAYNDYINVDENKASCELDRAQKRVKLNVVLEKVSTCLDYVDIHSLMKLEKAISKEQLPYNYYLPKTKNDKFTVKQNKSQTYPKELQEKVSIMIQKSIEKQIDAIEMDGSVKIKNGTKICIDSDLKKCPVPVEGRLDQNKNRSAATGTRFHIKEGDVLRAALYKQANHSQFIDFSAAIFDKNFKIVGQISWNNLKENQKGKLLGYHSGDSSACTGKGCTEVIDLDLNVVREVHEDAAYVAYMAVMWSGTKTSSCNELFMAIMPTAELGKESGTKIEKGGGVFDPKKVDFKIDIANEATTCIPMVYDINNHELLIVNMGVTGKDWHQVANNAKHFNLPNGCECIENYSGELAHMLHAYETMDVPTIYDLAMAYVKYRGAELVEDPSLADVVFATDRIKVEDKRSLIEDVENVPQVIVSPFDKDIITGELIPVPLAKMEKEMKKEKAVETKDIVETEIDFERE